MRKLTFRIVRRNAVLSFGAAKIIEDPAMVFQAIFIITRFILFDPVDKPLEHPSLRPGRGELVGFPTSIVTVGDANVDAGV